jgi:hypothetical protein
MNRDILENIFVTALEGGSNYWYYLSKPAYDIIRSVVPKEEDAYLSTAFLKAVLDHGQSIPINDAENIHDVLGYVSAETLYNRLENLNNDKGLRYCLNSEIDGIGDAETSDVCFQFIVMNEYVFG